MTRIYIAVSMLALSDLVAMGSTSRSCHRPRRGSIGLSQIRHSPFSDFSPRPNKGGSAQSRHVTRLLVQICNAELTAGYSELKYWVYFSTFCDIDFYTQFHIQ